MRLLALLLTPLIALQPVWAQTNSAQGALRLHVVEDSGTAVAKATTAKGYTVQVTDSSGAPVASAAVAFRLPDDGPSGAFANGLHAWVSYTDGAGIATFPVIQWSETTGAVEIKVTAAKGSTHAGLLVSQEVLAAPSANTTIVDVTVPAATVVEVPVVAAVIAKPTPPRPPKIETETAQATTIFQPFADVVPPPAAPKETPRTLTPNPPSSSSGTGGEVEPTVSIVNVKGGAAAGHEFNKKWLIWAAVGAAAGVAALAALHGGGGGGSSSSSSGVSIGGPTVSVGH